MRFVFTWLPCWSEKHHYSGVYRGSKFMHFDKSCAKMSQNHTSNLDKVFLNVPPSSDFGLEARILQIGWFYRPQWKPVNKSASKIKHPIKLHFFIWRFQSVNPEKKWFQKTKYLDHILWKVLFIFFNYTCMKIFKTIRNDSGVFVWLHSENVDLWRVWPAKVQREVKKY